jgi:hypothetical protein
MFPHRGTRRGWRGDPARGGHGGVRRRTLSSEESVKFFVYLNKIARSYLRLLYKPVLVPTTAVKEPLLAGQSEDMEGECVSISIYIYTVSF